jgi:hypothetical protein
LNKNIEISSNISAAKSFGGKPDDITIIVAHVVMHKDYECSASTSSSIADSNEKFDDLI